MSDTYEFEVPARASGCLTITGAYDILERLGQELAILRDNLGDAHFAKDYPGLYNLWFVLPLEE